ncbi:hypothetical protein DP939_33735 [Spongiactinospora rosea]|uniref:Cell envelope-related transcriptional attenuator domain-containing protein n=1 Tax=Spongiactinospora rosea TaxID=2248750 RepID=A0A366LNX3_9ACTN|nr:LCP family protein [Spongiactinospora rosea]RBQ15655.1 hypothetical protein DP939_33735 [Spongiactinospora rosea]
MRNGRVGRHGAESKGFGTGKGFALTAGSAVLWGLAHLVAWRGRTGLGLMAAQAAVVVAAVVLVTGHRARLLTLAVQPGWLTGLAAALVAVALVWVSVIVCSWRLVRPADQPAGPLMTAMVGLLCLVVATPTLLLARLAYVSSDLVTSVFAPGQGSGPDPWAGRRRLNILLLGADSAAGRYGVRTDSVTLATIDTATGRSVLFGLPRNLQRVPLPPGPARARFPWGFSGTPPHTPGLLNEIYQYAEEHPEIVPGAPRGRYGATLLKETVSGVLGLPVNYYVIIDMRGFAQLIDAIGGVTITVKDPIVYGRQNEGHIPAGTRRLSGEAALWFGRSRTDSSDYVRMSRQKCLLNAVVRQADPATLLRSFDGLAHAAKRAVATDIPQSLLPALIDLSAKVKDAPMSSVQFVPPLIDTAYPDYALIRRKVAQSLAALDYPVATPTHSPTGRLAPTLEPATPAQPSLEASDPPWPSLEPHDPSAGLTPTSSGPLTLGAGDPAWSPGRAVGLGRTPSDLLQPWTRPLTRGTGDPAWASPARRAPLTGLGRTPSDLLQPWTRPLTPERGAASAGLRRASSGLFRLWGGAGDPVPPPYEPDGPPRPASGPDEPADGPMADSGRTPRDRDRPQAEPPGDRPDDPAAEPGRASKDRSGSGDPTRPSARRTWAPAEPDAPTRTPSARTDQPRPSVGATATPSPRPSRPRRPNREMRTPTAIPAPPSVREDGWYSPAPVYPTAPDLAPNTDSLDTACQ